MTITHPEIRRFFMLIPEAVQLVLHAAAQAHSGEIYVLEMGEQVKVLDMARDLIRLSGFVPEEEIAIEFVGLRPGEKLYEELVGKDEHVESSAIDKILRVTSRTTPADDFPSSISALERAAAEGRQGTVISALQTLVGLSPAAEDATQSAASATPSNPLRDSSPARLNQPSEAFLKQSCPHCQSATLHRSRARTIAERLRRTSSVQRLFRCDTCDWRGWLIPLEFGDYESLEPVAVPDLVALDSAVQGGAKTFRPSFSPRDLQ